MKTSTTMGWLVWLTLTLASQPAGARSAAPADTAQGSAPQTIALWPQGWLPDVVRGPERVGTDGSATGAVSHISEPRMEIYRAAHPNGTAALILGGGGYFRLQIGTAARPMAQWLASIGVTSAVLYYRLPGDGWPAAAPFQDAQRAMRLLRSRADALGIERDKIGIIGSSAGANTAGITATRWDYAFYKSVDTADAVSARPDFVAMLYPVVSMQAPLDATRSARELSTQADYRAAYSVEQHVRNDMPPVFLAQAVDDPIVDIGHSVAMFQATRAIGVPVELHVFEKGGHSWGLGTPGTLVAQWPRLFANWARSHGFMGAPPQHLQPLKDGPSIPPANAGDAEKAIPRDDSDQDAGD